MNHKWKLILFSLLSCLGLLILAWVTLPSDKMEVTFFDVGQGDSILIKTPSNYHIIVDGGPNNRVLSHLGRSLPFWEKDIDLMVATHTDLDHLKGLLSLFDTYNIKKVWISDFVDKTPEYYTLVELAQKEGAVLEHPKAGDNIKVADSTMVEVVWPRSRAAQVPTPNDASIVLQVTLGEFSVLLTGDAESNTQPYIGLDEEIDVLKVPHHGSKAGLTKDYLEKLSPEVSIISAGKNNRYGHPDKTTLSLLEGIGSRVLNTAALGTIKVESDGKTWYTRSER